MGLISFLLLFALPSRGEELPKFLTKHPVNSIRFISNEGNLAYLKRRPGVLGIVRNFRGTDFLTAEAHVDFLVSGSRFRNKLVVEVVPHRHDELNLLKSHRISTVDWGQSILSEVAQGRFPKLHLQDEWISYFDPVRRAITLQNLVTDKKHTVKLTNSLNAFFQPEVEMLTADTVVYSDINEIGVAALIQLNVLTNKSKVLYKASQSGTRLELCQAKGYLGFGEFPYDGVQRSTKIFKIGLTGSTNLAGHEQLYSSVGQDLGNLLCLEESVYFIKTLGHDETTNLKVTEAARITLKTGKLEVRSELQNVTQILDVDGRLLIPFRGNFFVLEGSANLSEDSLKTAPKQVELPLDV